MYTDPRGGHNHKFFNKDFFKVWSPQMAYVLGYLYADGAIEDVRISSRTCYTTMTSVDHGLLDKIRGTLSSNHNIYTRKERLCTFPSGKIYLCRESYTLRIGSKSMFDDLIELGLTPRKSLTLEFPKIPKNLLSYFIRGYFDGDGCVMVSVDKGKILPSIKTVFTCGSEKFLSELNSILLSITKSQIKNVVHGAHAFQLCYKKYDSLKVLNFMYNGLNNAPFLERKYDIYQKYLLTIQN